MVTESSSLCLLFSFEFTRTRFKATSFIFDRVSANERLPFWIRRTFDGECFELMRVLIGRESFLRVLLDLVGRLVVIVINKKKKKIRLRFERSFLNWIKIFHAIEFEYK